jgi:oligopeptide/dipeptide ABC transporter ATP-binding protein
VTVIHRAAPKTAHGSAAAPPLLQVTDLTKHFAARSGPFGTNPRVVRAVDGISFSIEAGTTLALVGESGCGKTTTARLVLLLERATSGSIRFRDQDVASLRGAGLHAYRRAVQAVFQDPYSSLSPRMRVREIVGEPLEIHERLRGKELEARVQGLLHDVGLESAAANYYPHQFSGGQRQRIAVARALSLNPSLIVLDEPVSSLDVSIRAQILNLLVELQERLGLSYLLISHDLAIVEFMSHQIAVMYAGQIVERASRDEVYSSPLHPYTEALIAAVPKPDPGLPLRNVVGGEVANPADPPSGCRFHPRCPLREELGRPAICADEQPALREGRPGHAAACHFRPASS